MLKMTIMAVFSLPLRLKVWYSSFFGCCYLFDVKPKRTCFSILNFSIVLYLVSVIFSCSFVQHWYSSFVFFCFQQAGLLSTLALCYSHKQRSNIQRNNRLNKFGVHTIALYSCLQLNSNSNRFFAKCFSWDTNSSWFVLALLAGFHATWNLPPVNLCSKLNTQAYLSSNVLSKGQQSRVALMVIHRWPILINV